MLLWPAALACTLVTAPKPDVKVLPDITYATVGQEKLQLDLVLPPGPGPHPVVVCFHGGAWSAGSRKDLTRPAMLPTTAPTTASEPGILVNLARRGYAAATVSYRLAPKHKFPAQIEDAKTAVRFLRANAAKYSLDVDRVAAMGFSAGGHLALLLGTTDSSAGFDGGEHPAQSSKVQCVIDFFGPTDMALYAETPGAAEGFIAGFLGKECLTDPKVYQRASPLAYAGKSAAPTLFVHGTMDLIVPIVHSEKMLKKLKDDGVPVSMHKVPWKGHGWEDKDASRGAAMATLEFLNMHLPPKAEKK
ncbi:MAG: alpha/beta hydrolase [Fimbriiglobus sp.]|jgi:acetyl esterase/lipase|nr:alpha/beta hydrolase [Fimbriiglobus sp.]